MQKSGSGRKAADPAELRDIRSVTIDASLSRDERIKSYLRQIGNPYCYLDNGIVVHIRYADTSVSLADRIIILSERPARVSDIMPVAFSLQNDTPLGRRNAPEFKNYFNRIWKELNHHE